MRIVRLNHAVLFVTDVERAVSFYTEVMGFAVIAREPRMDAAFLRASNSDNHHDLGLFALGAGAPRRQRGQAGLYHLAWQVPTIEDLAAARQKLIEVGALTGESSHGATKSLYAVDPDGNELEIMWMLPRNSWGEYESSAIVEPLDLPAEIARWAGVDTR